MQKRRKLQQHKRSPGQLSRVPRRRGPEVSKQNLVAPVIGRKDQRTCDVHARHGQPIHHDDHCHGNDRRVPVLQQDDWPRVLGLIVLLQ